MKKLQVLGPGCPKCIELAKRAEEAAKASGLDYELEKVSELNKIMSFGVFMTPALVVDGDVMVVGKVPSDETITYTDKTPAVNIVKTVDANAVGNFNDLKSC